jgi:hypothetical protein
VWGIVNIQITLLTISPKNQNFTLVSFRSIFSWHQSYCNFCSRFLRTGLHAFFKPFPFVSLVFLHIVSVAASTLNKKRRKKVSCPINQSIFSIRSKQGSKNVVRRRSNFLFREKKTRVVLSRVARFLGKTYQNGKKWPRNLLNSQKIYHLAVKYTTLPWKYRHLPLQDLTNFTQIRIPGLKICHLATLVQSPVVKKMSWGVAPSSSVTRPRQALLCQILKKCFHN